MSPFESALIEEDKWLAKLSEQPYPEDPRAGNRVYIGPCLPPFRALKWALIGEGWQRVMPEEEEPEPLPPEKDFCCIPKPPG